MKPSETLEPVTTEGGEYIRQLGLRVLRKRYERGLATGERRHLTEAERSDTRRTAAAIEQLQAMAPRGRLQPPREDGLLLDVLPNRNARAEAPA